MKALLILLIALAFTGCVQTQSMVRDVLQNSTLTVHGYVQGDSVCTEITVTHPLIGTFNVYGGCRKIELMSDAVTGPDLGKPLANPAIAIPAYNGPILRK